MGKAGRIACIFTPYVLTAASLVCLIFVGLGSTNSNSSTLNNIYFFRVSFARPEGRITIVQDEADPEKFPY